ncbi:uncharacterized protein C1orf131-like [Teleopsis dalmanni]|uniref:uncharacterized protein C1orf131-like n=1 Tax=Teleopsis dalmanni TaxID=139649 RepID=UPI0018CD036A|nr:uncharacterized protein C1orf131-like [Teleopsis dalmanni]
MAEEVFQPVQTRASLTYAKRNKCNEFKALHFIEPKISASTSARDGIDQQNAAENIHKFKTEKQNENKIKDKNEFDIKTARHEVLKFAMNNQRVIKNQKKMLVFQAVKLGAKPPKKAYKNYKELKDERKRLKDIREQRKKFHQLGKNQTGAASVKCRSKTKLDKLKKKRAPVSRIDQNYGVVKSKKK